MSNQLHDAIKAYQYWDKRPHKAGEEPVSHRSWVLSVRELHYAAEDAWRSVQPDIDVYTSKDAKGYIAPGEQRQAPQLPGAE